MVEAQQGEPLDAKLYVADLLYYNPKVFLYNPGEFDQEKVKEIQAELGYPKIIRERTVGYIPYSH